MRGMGSKSVATNKVKSGEILNLYVKASRHDDDDDDGPHGICKVSSSSSPEYAIKDGTPNILDGTYDVVVVVKVLHVLRRDVKVE